MSGAAGGQVRMYKTGDVIIAEGPNSPKELVIVLQGTVAVIRNYKLATEQRLRVLGQGRFHGELSLFLGRDQEETLVAISDVIVLAITRDGVNDLFISQPDTTFTIIEGICRQLAETSDELRKLRGVKPEASRHSKLFPEGHGSYTLPLQNDSDCLLPGSETCPLCGHSFKVLNILESKLRPDGADSALIPRFRDFEPLFYEIRTCPNCLLSVPTGQFRETPKRYEDLVNQKVGPFKLEMYVRTGDERDTFTVFAGYYLAMLCAPIIFFEHQTVTANLWLKLARLYLEAGDEAMYMYASQRSLDDFLYVYDKVAIPEKTVQQVCYLIGELSVRTGDYDNALNYFYLSSKNKEGTPVLVRQAELRIDEVKELKKKKV